MLTIITLLKMSHLIFLVFILNLLRFTLICESLHQLLHSLVLSQALKEKKEKLFLNI